MSTPARPQPIAQGPQGPQIPWVDTAPLPRGPQTPWAQTYGGADPQPNTDVDDTVAALAAPRRVPKPPTAFDDLRRSFENEDATIAMRREELAEMPPGQERSLAALALSERIQRSRLARLEYAQKREDSAAPVSSFVMAAGRAYADGIGSLIDLFMPPTVDDPVYGRVERERTDLVAGVMGIAGFPQEKLVNIRKETDQYLQDQLGHVKIAADAVGLIASMGTGVGRQIGILGERAAAATLGKITEKALIGGALARAPQLAAQVQKGENAALALFRLPEWKKQADFATKALAFSGKHARDVIGVTAGNALQAFAMSPDGERGNALLMAAITGPFLVPIARLGQHVGGKIAAIGVKGKAAQEIHDAYIGHAAGQLSSRELDRVIRANSNASLRVLGNVAVSPMLEGTAFWGMQPETIKDLYAYANGDQEAGARAFMSWMGSVSGLAVIKGVTPDLAPMFRHVRPDLNNMRLRSEAWANQEIAKRMNEEAVRDLEQDPVKQANREAEAATQDQAQAEFNRQRQQAADEQRMQQQVDDWQNELRRQTIERYEYANEPAEPLLRAGFEAERVADSDAVILRMHGDDNATVRLDPDGSVAAPQSMFDVLTEIGRPHQQSGETRDADTHVLRGDAAKQFLHDVAMVSMFRRAVGASILARHGLVDQGDGTWSTPPDQQAAPQHWTANFDGTFTTTNWPGNSKQRLHVEAFGEMDMPAQRWNHQTATLLAHQIAVKMGVAPDPIVDQMIAAALNVARFGHGRYADEVRAYLETVTPDQLLSRINVRDMEGLAYDLGALATGTNNADALLMETRPAETTRARQMRDVARASYDRQATATVKVTRRQAKMLADWAIKSSPLGKRLAELRDDATQNGGTVELTGKDFKRLAELWDKYGAGKTEDPGNRESVDNWFRETREALGGVSEAQVQRKSVSEILLERGRVVADMRQTEGNWVETPDGQWVRLTDQPTPDPDAPPVTEGPPREPDPAFEALPKPPAPEKPKTPAARKAKAVEQARALRESGNKVTAKRLAKETGVSKRAAEEIVQDVFREPELTPAPEPEAAPEVVRGEEARPEPTTPDDQPSKLVKPKPETDPEAGFVILEADMPGAREVAEDVGAVAKGIGRAIKSIEQTYRAEVEALGAEAPGSRLETESKKVIARQEQLTGAQGPRVRRIMELLKTKDGKALMGEKNDPNAWVGTGERTDMTRLRALIEGHVKPRNETEAQILAEFNGMLSETWQNLRRAGAVRQVEGEGMAPMGDRVSHRLPQVRGKDWSEVIGTEKLRRALAEETARLNPDSERTADDLFKEWTDKVEGTSKTNEAPEREAAAEFVRDILLPDRIKVGDTVYEVLESNPLRVFESVTRQHAVRAAVLEVMGQGVANKEVALRTVDKWLTDGLITPEDHAAIRGSIERGGTEAVLDEFMKNVVGQGDPKDFKTLRTRAEDALKRLQDIDPEAIGDLGRAFSRIVSDTSRVLTVKAGIHDVPELFTRLMAFFPRHAVQAFLKGIRSPQQAIELAQDLGYISRPTNELSMEAARGAVSRGIDALMKPSQFLENLKAGIAARAAERLLAGKMTRGEIETLRDVGGVPVEVLDRVEAGRATDLDRAMIGQAVVRLVNSRSPRALMSRLGASTRLAQFVRFTRWASGRMGDTVKSFAALAKPGLSPAARGRAALRLGRLLVGSTVSGAIAQTLGLTISEWTKGNPMGGIERVLNGLSLAWQHGWWETAKEIGQFTAGGLAGAPFQAAVLAITEGKDMLAPAGMAEAARTVVESVGRGDMPGVVRGFGRLGVIPLGGDIANVWNLALYGQAVADRRADSRMVNDWRASVDRARPDIGGHKPEEFYEVLRKAADDITATEGDPEARWKALESTFQQGLGIGTGKEIAGYLRARQHLFGLSSEDVVRFINENPRELVDSVLEHDMMLRDMATIAGQHAGTERTTWGEDMTTALTLADNGRGEALDGLVQRALTMATAGAGTPAGIQFTELREVADALADRPGMLKHVFGGDNLRMVERNMTTAARSMRIFRLLRERAQERVLEKRREANKARRGR